MISSYRAVLILEIAEITCYFFLQEGKKLLKCSCCGKLVHSTCLMPPIDNLVPEEWSCHLCKEKTDEYLLKRQAYITELQKRLITTFLLRSECLVVWIFFGKQNVLLVHWTWTNGNLRLIWHFQIGSHYAVFAKLTACFSWFGPMHKLSGAP